MERKSFHDVRINNGLDQKAFQTTSYIFVQYNCTSVYQCKDKQRRYDHGEMEDMKYYLLFIVLCSCNQNKMQNVLPT